MASQEVVLALKSVVCGTTCTKWSKLYLLWEESLTVLPETWNSHDKHTAFVVKRREIISHVQ